MSIVVLAHLGKPFAVRGWQFLVSYTNPPKNILSYVDNLLIATDAKANDWTACSFAGVELQSDRIVVQLTGVDNPEEAAIYTQRAIGVDRCHLPDIEDGYYWCDLIGMQVVYDDPESGTRLNYGKVDSLSSAGGRHDILHVSDSKNTSQRLIPFIQDIYVRKVDMAAGIIEVLWPPDY